jgi:Glycosyl transferase family 2
MIPCYNYGNWLRDCVMSVLRQTGVDVDVVIVNDASSDNTIDVARALTHQDPRTRLIDHKENRGQIPSVNEAIEQANGDYIVKLDPDDMLAPNSLARSAALLEANPTVGFVYGRPLHFGSHLRTMSWSHKWFRRHTLSLSDHPPENTDSRVQSWTIWPGETWMALLCDRAANCISQPEVVIRTAALRAIGGFDVKLPHTFDLAMWLDLASISDVAHIDGAIQGLYRVHSGSLQRTLHAGKLLDLRARLAAFDSVLHKRAHGMKDAARLLATVHRRLASEALEEACRAFDRGRTRSEPVDDFVAFALATYPDAPSLREWRSLQRRKRVGARLSPYCPPFFLGATTRRMKEEIGAARWWQDGI